MPIRSTIDKAAAEDSAKQRERERQRKENRAAEYEERKRCRAHYGKRGRYNPMNGRWEAE
jgi:hypothetical protein